MHARRALLRVAAFALTGAAASLLVAFACAAWSPVEIHQFLERSLQNGAWEPWVALDPAPVPHPRMDLLTSLDESRWEPPNGYHLGVIRQNAWLADGFGASRDLLESSLGYERHDNAFIVDSNLVLWHAGWPFHCVQSRTQSEVSGAPSHLHIDRAAPPTGPQFGFRLPAFLRLRSTPPDRVLPLTPVWPGLAANTACYAASLWLLSSVHLTLRRLLRLRRNHCPICNYNRQGLPPSTPCPECGPV